MTKLLQQISQDYDNDQIYKKNIQNFNLLKKAISQFEVNPNNTFAIINYLYKQVVFKNISFTEKQLIFETYIELSHKKINLHLEQFQKIIFKFFEITIVKIMSLKFSLNIVGDYYLNLHSSNNLSNMFVSKYITEPFNLKQLVNDKWNYSYQEMKIVQYFFHKISQILSTSSPIVVLKIHSWIFYMNNNECLAITNLHLLTKINEITSFKKLSYISFNYQEIINEISNK